MPTENSPSTACHSGDYSRSLLAAIVASSDDAIISKSVDGVITSWNAGAERLLGYTAAEAIGQPITLIIPADRLDEEKQILARVGAGERVEHFETLRRAKDGRLVALSLTVSPVRDERGRIVGASKVARDITSHRTAQAAQALLAAIVASSDDAIISKTLDGVVTSWNAAAERLFGYSAAEAIGRSITMIIPPERADEEVHILGKVRRGERLDHFDTVRRAKDGRLIELSITVSPVRDEAGRVVGASKVARDITERRAIEAELRRYREDLEQAVSARTAALEESSRKLRAAERAAALGTLAAGFGHDMANLLLPIFARLDAIEAAALPSEVRADLAAVRSAATYLQRLSSGLRLMAMDPAEGGVGGPTDLGAWWDDVDGILTGVLPRGVRLEAEGVRESGLHLAMSQHRLTQAVFNLVQNAAEAIGERGHGTVRVTARPAGGVGARAGVLLRVQDDGPGMSEETRRRCFEPYFSTKGRAISTGMGLSLVRSLARGSGGTIDVESAPGRGATFSLWLPVGEPARAHRSGQAPPRATVSILGHHRAAFAAAILEMTGVEPVRRPLPEAGDQLWVTEEAAPDAVERFLAQGGKRVVLAGASGRLPDELRAVTGRVTVLSGTGSGVLRRELMEAAHELCAAGRNGAEGVP